MTERERTHLAAQCVTLLEHLESAAAAQSRVLSLIDGLADDDREQLRFEQLRTECLPRLNYLRNVHVRLQRALCRTAHEAIPPRPVGRPIGLTKWC